MLYHRYCLIFKINKEIDNRELIFPKNSDHHSGFGRNLFAILRKNAAGAENGAGLDLINSN